MSTDGSVTRWIAQLELGQAGEAEEQLWQRYFHRLVGLARVKLGDTPRAVADEEDVATAALCSFFQGVAHGRFPRLRDRDSLWPLLAKITTRKAIDQKRFLTAEKRGGGQLRGDSVLAGSSASWAELVDRDLQPEFLAELNEEYERLLQLLGDNDLRNIARRRLEGYSNAEIAAELKVMVRTVERRLQLIRAIWSNDPSSTPDT